MLRILRGFLLIFSLTWRGTLCQHLDFRPSLFQFCVFIVTFSQMNEFSVLPQSQSGAHFYSSTKKWRPLHTVQRVLDAGLKGEQQLIFALLHIWQMNCSLFKWKCKRTIQPQGLKGLKGLSAHEKEAPFQPNDEIKFSFFNVACWFCCPCGASSWHVCVLSQCDVLIHLRDHDYWRQKRQSARRAASRGKPVDCSKCPCCRDVQVRHENYKLK